MLGVISRDLAVAAVRRVLEEQVVGQTLPGFKCHGVEIPTSEVVGIRRPSGDPSEWWKWTVEMRVLGANDGWRTTLAWFMGVEELERLFGHHFGDATAEGRLVLV